MLEGGIGSRIATIENRFDFNQDLTFYLCTGTERFGHIVLGHDKFCSVYHNHFNLGVNLAGYQTAIDTGSADFIRGLPVFFGLGHPVNLLHNYQ